MNTETEFLGIGDIVVDDFIDLQYAHVRDDNPEGIKNLCINFGDKIPYKESVLVPAVGNSANASVSAKRLGINSGLITNMGDDSNGKICLDKLNSEGIDTEYVKLHPNEKTNYHYVLRYGAERTILINHANYDYKLPEFKTLPKWIYLSSLSEESLNHHDEISDFLDKNPEVKLAFQPGTFQIKIGKERLKRLYEHSEIFFCNKEEANYILGSSESDIKVLLKNMHALGPKIAVITDGPNGAFVFDGEKFLKGAMYPDPKPPVDRTGAGDSFSSTFVCALILGLDIKEALRWGPVNSMSVVQHIGAQKGLLTREELEKYLEDAPESYTQEEF